MKFLSPSSLWLLGHPKIFTWRPRQLELLDNSKTVRKTKVGVTNHFQALKPTLPFILFGISVISSYLWHAFVWYSFQRRPFCLLFSFKLNKAHTVITKLVSGWKFDELKNPPGLDFHRLFNFDFLRWKSLLGTVCGNITPLRHDKFVNVIQHGRSCCKHNTKNIVLFDFTLTIAINIINIWS